MKKLNLLFVAMFFTFGVYAQTASEEVSTEVNSTSTTEQNSEASQETALQKKGAKKSSKVKGEDADHVKEDKAPKAKDNKGSEISALAKETPGGPEKGKIMSAAASGDKHAKAERAEVKKPNGAGQKGRPETVRGGRPESAGRPTGANVTARRPMNAGRPANAGKH